MLPGSVLGPVAHDEQDTSPVITFHPVWKGHVTQASGKLAVSVRPWVPSLPTCHVTRGVLRRMRHHWVEQTWKILEDAGLERPEGRGLDGKEQRAGCATVHMGEGYVKDGGGLIHLSMLRLLQQNTGDGVAYRGSFSRLGSPRLRKGWVQWLVRAYFLFIDGVFLLCPRTVKRQENSGSLGSLL